MLKSQSLYDKSEATHVNESVFSLLFFIIPA